MESVCYLGLWEGGGWIHVLSGVKKATEDSVLSKTELNCYFYFYMFIVNDVAIWAQ